MTNTIILNESYISIQKWLLTKRWKDHKIAFSTNIDIKHKNLQSFKTLKTRMNFQNRVKET